MRTFKWSDAKGRSPKSTSVQTQRSLYGEVESVERYAIPSTWPYGVIHLVRLSRTLSARFTPRNVDWGDCSQSVASGNLTICTENWVSLELTCTVFVNQSATAIIFPINNHHIFKISYYFRRKSSNSAYFFQFS